MRTPTLRRAAHGLLRAVDASPSWLPARTLFDPIKAVLSRETGSDELLRVADALEAASVRYWLAGGWGVDALLGRQTRTHRDLDIVIDKFESNEPKARHALEAIGFRHVKFDTAGAWMPLRSTLDDDSGHKVELMGIDRSRLMSAMGVRAGGEDATSEFDDQVGEVFTEGTVNRRKVPCLSARVQRLFHTGFHLEPGGRHNVGLLDTEIGSALRDDAFDVAPNDPTPED
jgi:lincosamide nucleotidyltransferase A/C/D/E